MQGATRGWGCVSTLFPLKGKVGYETFFFFWLECYETFLGRLKLNFVGASSVSLMPSLENINVSWPVISFCQIYLMHLQHVPCTLQSYLLQFSWLKFLFLFPLKRLVSSHDLFFFPWCRLFPEAES